MATVDEIRRQVQELNESVTWERAATDPAFRAASKALEDWYRAADLETWPPEPAS